MVDCWGDLPLSGSDCSWVERRWTADGAGKLFFLSIASTVRWKRRKRDSARVRIGRRSIVLESSLTGMLVRRVVFKEWVARGRTVFQDFVKVFQVVHDDVAVFL